ncbi:hypothetical protein, partial [Dactylosporangium matsuzakiense]|uniref:hypothetical protein n=1 Tax=Dactylosporangium matsuzakiense TaxID=53360 RepID=UPI0022F34966
MWVLVATDGSVPSHVTVMSIVSAPWLNTAVATVAGPGFTQSTRHGTVAWYEVILAWPAAVHPTSMRPAADVKVWGRPGVGGGGPLGAGGAPVAADVVVAVVAAAPVAVAAVDSDGGRRLA